MLDRIVKWFMTKRAKRLLEENQTILGVQHFLLKELFSDEREGLWVDAPEEVRKQVYKQNLEKTIEIVAADNPVLRNREWHVASVLTMAELNVIFIPPEPELDSTGLRGYRGITGDLKKYIDKIIEIEYPELLMEFGSLQDARDSLSLQYWRAGFDASVSNFIRVSFGDYREGEDWYRPFCQSIYACYEHHHREAIGLPTILEPIEVLAESSFLDLVITGEKWPDIQHAKLIADARKLAKGHCSP